MKINAYDALLVTNRRYRVSVSVSIARLNHSRVGIVTESGNQPLRNLSLAISLLRRQ